MNRRLAYVMSVGVVVLGTKTSGYGQASGKPLQLASREPTFYAIIGSHVERTEARSLAILREHVALRLRNATIQEALKAIEAQTALRFAFKPAILPSGATVSLDASDITVAAALTQILLDADVDVEIAPYGLASLVPRQPREPAPDTTTGTIVGHVTDSKTQQGIPYASVLAENTAHSATANDRGEFRLTRVPAGTYSVVARRVGYVVGRRSVTVVGGQVATLDFTLEQSANSLDQVVVTGTLVPAATKSIPVPITVVSDSEIAEQQPRTVNEIFRQYVPTAVSFDQFSQPNQTYLSVRGATELQQGGTQVKVFIDGVEAANSSGSPVDPASIDHIEVIRGPEAAAIYGSGAIDGVIQIFTKHGSETNGRPSIDGQLGAADVQTPYAGYRGILRQTYSGDIRGGTQDASYTVGGGFTQTNNYLPFGALSSQSTPSAYSGIHYNRGVTTLDVSARYLTVNAPAVSNPEYQATNPPQGSYQGPSYMGISYTNATVGASLQVQPLPEWRNVLTIGYDETNSELVQRRPHLSTPADTLLGYSYANENKISLRAAPSLTGHLGSAITATLIVGADYWVVSDLSTGSFGTYNTTGNIATDSNSPFTASRYPTHNTGAFAQTQIDVLDALFVTAGVRADWNSDFGDSIATPISPRLGIAYSHSLGFSTIKLRASWGSAILPPSTGTKDRILSGFQLQLANAHLLPERQHGEDGGFDILFGQVGTFSATYFNQTAINLIQQVQLPSDTLYTLQNQNVGTVTNSGVELEGRVGLGRLSLRLMYGYTRARVDNLAPGYTGDYHVGDQAFDVPRHNAGGSLSLQLWHGTNVAAGLTYVGPWTDYDNIRENVCLTEYYSNNGNTTGCPAAIIPGLATGNFNTRSFLMQYPSLVKGNVHVTQTLNRWVSAFVSLENIGDNQGYEASNQSPRVGRISTIGLRLHY